MKDLTQETSVIIKLNKLFNKTQLLSYFDNEYDFANTDGQLGISKNDIKLNIKQCQDILKIIINDIHVLEFLKESELKMLKIGSDLILNLINTNSEDYHNLTDSGKKTRFRKAMNKLQDINKLLHSPTFIYYLFNESSLLRAQKTINELLSESKNINAEAIKNAKSIEDLIPSATANSLSNELNIRVKGLVRRTNAWLIFILVILGGTTIVSLNFYQNTKNINFPFEILLLRLIIFLPIFYLIVFSIRQYNKDRKLLEIYIHKKSIAQTLPAYMAQAKNTDLANEILLRGTSVIYTHPENPDIPVPITNGIPLKEVKSLIEVVSKN